MKKLSLLFILCMLPMLAFAQTDSTLPPANPCLTGSGVYVIPASWNFATIARDFSEDKVFVLCNDRSNNITITSISAAPYPPFKVIASLTTCPDPGVLPSGDTPCDITVQFDAGEAGQHLGALTIECSGAPACPITVALSGTAEADVTLNPRTFDFGSVQVGNTSAAEAFTLTNNEPEPLHITAIETDPDGIFPVEDGSNKCKTTQPVPAGGSCYVWAAFSPDEVGPASGTLQVTTDSPDGQPATVSLTGTGTPRCPPIGCCPPPCCPPGNPSGDIICNPPPQGAALPSGAVTPFAAEPLTAYLHTLGSASE